jgi:hypothetical protein
MRKKIQSDIYEKYKDYTKTQGLVKTDVCKNSCFKFETDNCPPALPVDEARPPKPRHALSNYAYYRGSALDVPAEAG